MINRVGVGLNLSIIQAGLQEQAGRFPFRLIPHKPGGGGLRQGIPIMTEQSPNTR